MAAELAEIHADICEIKGMLKVIDMWLERSVAGYRHPEDMRAIRDGRV